MSGLLRVLRMLKLLDLPLRLLGNLLHCMLRLLLTKLLHWLLLILLILQGLLHRRVLGMLLLWRAILSRV